MLYLDSSAIVKLVVREPGSSGLVDVVSSDPDEFRVHPHENDVPYDWARKDG